MMINSQDESQQRDETDATAIVSRHPIIKGSEKNAMEANIVSALAAARKESRVDALDQAANIARQQARKRSKDLLDKLRADEARIIEHGIRTLLSEIMV